MLTQNLFINLLVRDFKVIRNSVYFIVIAFMVAELLKIFIYANKGHVTSQCGHKMI